MKALAKETMTNSLTAEVTTESLAKLNENVREDEIESLKRSRPSCGLNDNPGVELTLCA